MMNWHDLSRGLLAALTLAASTSFAQTYPTKQINLIVPWPAGTASDVGARVIANDLKTTLGQNLIVENPAGAGGSIGLSKALAAPADGYTLMMTSQQDLVMAPLVYKSAAYKPEDTRTVAMVGHTTLTLVTRKDLPVATLSEFAALMKSSSKPLTYCTPGLGTLYPVVVEKLSAIAQAKALQVPYPGFGQCLNDIAGGVVDFAIVPIAGPYPGFVDSGQVKAIAVLSDTPNQRLPKVPLVTATKGYENLRISVWAAFHVHAKTPDAVVESLNKAVYAALAKPEVRGPIEAGGTTLFAPMTPKQANDYFLKDAREIEALAKGMGISKQ